LLFSNDKSRQRTKRTAWAYITLLGSLARRCYWFPRRFLYEAIQSLAISSWA
jgi:hypothetical protein